MAFNYSPKIVTNGLVLCLDAGNVKSYVSGSTSWNDLTSNQNVGTLTNGPTFNTGSGGSIVFDGVNDYLNLGNPSTLNILNFTVCAWAKSSTFTNYQNIIFKGTTTGQYGIALNSSGDWTIQPNTGFTGDILSLNTWNFFVGTYNGTQITAYRNGVQKQQYSIAQSYFGSVITVGTDTVNSRYFNGNIAQVSIYNRALSSTEILQNYNALKGRFDL